jgi:hypothetical protein
MAKQYKKKTPKTTPFSHLGVIINWSGVRVCKAEYKGLELEIRGNGMYSRSLYIDGRKAHSSDTIDSLKRYAAEYLKGG